MNTDKTSHCSESQRSTQIRRKRTHAAMWWSLL